MQFSYLINIENVHLQKQRLNMARVGAFGDD